VVVEELSLSPFISGVVDDDPPSLARDSGVRVLCELGEKVVLFLAAIRMRWKR